MVRILGLEAAAKVAGVALVEDGRVIARASVANTLTHSETLMPMVQEVMERAGLKIADLSAIAFSAGPGSFTGLRIGAATAKGLADACHLPLVPVSTLEALAMNFDPCFGEEPTLFVPMMDARRSQVYTAAYEIAGGRPAARLAPCCIRPEELEDWLNANAQGQVIRLNGEGAPLYADHIRAHLTVSGSVVLADETKLLESADSVALLGCRYYSDGKFVDSEHVELAYLRKPQAEREREERLQSEGRADD